MIKQALLSHEAADGEIAVIEAEAVGYAQANIKTLISVLVQGKDHQRSLDLVFHDAPVKLRLVKGSGPVHLVGAHGVGKFKPSNLSWNCNLKLTQLFLQLIGTWAKMIAQTKMVMEEWEMKKN